MHRSWNQRALIGTLAVAAVAAEWSTSGAAIMLAPVLIAACYVVGRHLDSLAAAMWAIGAGVVIALGISVATADLAWFTIGINVLLPALFLIVLPWWVGRSRLLTVTYRMREYEQIAVQARLLERQRIARAMHDQLGHDLALIALRASALQVAPASDPAVREAASTIRQQADDAVGRLHEILTVLRDDTARAALTPSEESVTELVDRLRDHGVDIALTLDGDPPGVGAVWEAATYRIVQEATTNAMKHAPGAPIRIDVDTRGPARIRVTNPVIARGRGAGERAGARPGDNGLAGLAAHVDLLGGRFDAEHGGDEFVLEATFPPVADFPAEPAVAGSRRPRRGRGRTAALPVALILILLGGIAILQVMTFTATALPPATFDELRIGMSTAEVAANVTAKGLDEGSPQLAEPPRPPAAECRYYAARSSAFDLSSDMFRLCEREGTLVSKDHLLPGAQGQR